MPVITDKRTDISESDEQEIATTLQYLLMNEIFSNSRWRAPHAVFHGGTALSMLHDTGRWSEDLDFMIDEELFATLEKTMANAAERLQILARKIYPDCQIDLNGPKGKTEVKAWYFGWTHPNKYGKVRVKTEFLPKPTDLLRGYKTVQVIPVGSSLLPVAITSFVHGPQLISSWADKIIAMSQRPYFKWRDVYDLWFLDTRMKALSSAKDTNIRTPYPSDDEFLKALEATASIYGKTPDDVRIGLEVLLSKNIFDDADGYKKDIAKWLPEEVKSNDQLLELHRTVAKHEIERVLTVILENAETPRP